MFGMTVEIAVDVPPSAHVVLLRMLGKLFTAVAVYDTEALRTRPAFVMVTDRVGAAGRPARGAAAALKRICAVGVATVLFCAIIAGVTAAMAAASAAGFNCTFL